MHSLTYPCKRPSSRIPVSSSKSQSTKKQDSHKSLQVITRIKEVIARLEEEFDTPSLQNLAESKETTSCLKRSSLDNRLPKNNSKLYTEVLYNIHEIDDKEELAIWEANSNKTCEADESLFTFSEIWHNENKPDSESNKEETKKYIYPISKSNAKHVVIKNPRTTEEYFHDTKMCHTEDLPQYKPQATSTREKYLYPKRHNKEVDAIPIFPPGTKLCPHCAEAINRRMAARNQQEKAKQ